MGFISLSVKKNNIVKPYIIVEADYLQEAWIAETFDDNKTRIIQQFKYKEFKNCFPELANCMVHLGEIVKITSDEIAENDMDNLLDVISKKVVGADPTLLEFVSSRITKLIGKIQCHFLQPIMDYRLLSLKTAA